MSYMSPMIEDLQERLQADFAVDRQPLPAKLQHALNELAAAEKKAAAVDRAMSNGRNSNGRDVSVLIDDCEARQASLPLLEIVRPALSTRAQLSD